MQQYAPHRWFQSLTLHQTYHQPHKTPRQNFRTTLLLLLTHTPMLGHKSHPFRVPMRALRQCRTGSVASSRTINELLVILKTTLVLWTPNTTGFTTASTQSKQEREEGITNHSKSVAMFTCPSTSIGPCFFLCVSGCLCYSACAQQPRHCRYEDT